MIDTKIPLISEFLKDHQQMTRLLHSIAELLREGNIEQARMRASQLDTVAGPHIAYEECELYPRLAGLGVTQVTDEKLVGQHHQVVNSLSTLLASESLDETSLSQVISGFQTGLDHAEHCGSLISLMSRLSEEQQNQSLAVLLQLRERGQKWTELSNSGAEESA